MCTRVCTQVAGVVGRADLMCAVFYLSCLLFYHYHVTTSQVTDIPHYPVEKPKGTGHSTEIRIGMSVNSFENKVSLD